VRGKSPKWSGKLEMEIGAEPEPKTWEDVVPDFDFRFGGLEATALSPTTMSR